MQQTNCAPGGQALIKAVCRVTIIATGFALVAAGLFMLVLPGPGILIILLGLALLAREFGWARRLLARAKVAGKRGSASLRTLIGFRTPDTRDHA